MHCYNHLCMSFLHCATVRLKCALLQPFVHVVFALCYREVKMCIVTTLSLFVLSFLHCNTVRLKCPLLNPYAVCARRFYNVLP